MKRSEMNELASELGISYKLFRNKQTLWEEIVRKRKEPDNKRPSERCYNQHDPCTLQHVDEIQDLVEWTHTVHGKPVRFGASKCSLLALFASTSPNQPVILPWAVDLCSGVDAAANLEWFQKTFDIRNNSDIQRALSSEHEQPNEAVWEPACLNVQSVFVFGVEQLADNNPYLYGVLLNRVVSANRRVIYDRVSGSMTRVLYMLQDNPLQRDIFYTFCYISYTSSSFHLSKSDHLIFLLDTLRNYVGVAGPFGRFVVNLIFMEL